MGHNTEKQPLSQRRKDILPKFFLVVTVPNFPAVTVSKDARVDTMSKWNTVAGEKGRGIAGYGPLEF